MPGNEPGKPANATPRNRRAGWRGSIRHPDRHHHPPDATREMVERYRQGARVSEVHSDAGDPSGDVRRISDAAYEANANVRGEPGGYGRNVSGYNQVDAHTKALMAVAAASSGQAVRLHVVAGRHRNGQSRRRFDGGEAFDSMPGFAEVPALPRGSQRTSAVHAGPWRRVPARPAD